MSHVNPLYFVGAIIDSTFNKKQARPGTQKAISRTKELNKKYIGFRALIICMS